MEKDIKYVMGNVYGSYISKNGKWLNVTITTTINGEIYRITAPVHIGEGESGKPFAIVEQYAATIKDLRVYAKPQKQVDDLPF